MGSELVGRNSCRDSLCKVDPLNPAGELPPIICLLPMKEDMLDETVHNNMV